MTNEGSREQQAEPPKKNLSKQESKPKRPNKADLGPDFVAPDGGWAWIVCLAAGFSSFCVFTPVQQYGIIYRQRMHDLSFDARQITTIINSELATAALTGIINGVLFRRFTFRKVAFVGGLLVFVGIFSTAYSTTFFQYFICFSLFYGIGLGTNLSATALALNTYFQNNRRRATGFSTTITGLGPIMLPHICTFLLELYGTQGTIELVAAFSLNTLVCACTLQPVKWHVKAKKKKKSDHEAQIEISKEITFIEKFQTCQYCQDKNIFENGLISKGFFLPDNLKYEDAACEASMLALASDGWLGSITSLNSLSSLQSLRNSKSQFPTERRRNTAGELTHSQFAKRDFFETDHHAHCTCDIQTSLLQEKNNESSTEKQSQNNVNDTFNKKKNTLKDKVIKTFDLDLLTDPTFVNLIQGMTIMMFCELNFSFLTPFILSSYGHTNQQISLAMSILAGVDIVVRFTAPLLFDKIKISNKMLFACGIVILLMGRIMVTITNSFYELLVIFFLMGFGKGLRTISSPLIIPSYVPLSRLPGAAGLQLFLNALFTMAVGPLLGLIADIKSYTFTVHFLNLMTISSLFFWILEWSWHRISRKQNQEGVKN